MDDRPKGGVSDEKWRSDMASSLRRLNEQLSKEDWRHHVASNVRHIGEELARGIAQETIFHASRALDCAAERRLERELKLAERREAKRARKAERKRERDEHRMEQTTAFEGYAQIMAALVMLAVLFHDESLWWLVFPAMGLGIRGARIIGYKREQHALSQPPVQLPAPVKSSVDPRLARIDEICNKLLAALKDAPAAVRDFLSTPEQTVELLRKSSHDLLKRELDLRALATPEDSARLDRERVTLQARIAAESDDVVRVRLQGALVALDNQQRQQAEILKSANRLDAERTRLGYTLDGLYAQVMRVKSAGASSDDVVQAGLRQSLDQLRDEMSALADAVEEVNHSTTPDRSLDAPSAQSTRGGAQRTRS